MSTEKIKYSTRLMSAPHSIFIDGVCVKSRYNKETNNIEIAIENALNSSESVLVQEGDDVKIYVNNEELESYKNWINEMYKDNSSQQLLQAFKNKSISVITSRYKDGYPFFNYDKA